MRDYCPKPDLGATRLEDFLIFMLALMLSIPEARHAAGITIGTALVIKLMHLVRVWNTNRALSERGECLVRRYTRARIYYEYVVAIATAAVLVYYEAPALLLILYAAEFLWHVSLVREYHADTEQSGD